MFRDFVYLNTDALSRYSTRLLGNRGLKLDSAKAKGGLSFGFAKADVELEGTAPQAKDIFSIYDEFESKLAEVANEEYFDFISNQPDEATLPDMSIIRFKGTVEIPEAFDMIDTIRQFAPMLNTFGMLPEDNNSVSNEFVLNLLSNKNADVPILADGLDMLVSSKLKTDYISENDVTSLEDLQDEEAIILCKVVARCEGDKVLIYDPLKDFMKLSRTVRRNTKRTEGLEQIYEAGPVLKVETIAIYH